MPTVIDKYHDLDIYDQDADKMLHRDHFSFVYQLKKAEKRTKLNSVSDIYRNFIENWSESVMEWVMGYKVLLLDRQEKTIADIYFEPVSDLRPYHIEILFKIISEMPDANSIIIGRNHASRDFKPDQREKAFATIFKECARKSSIQLKDQYVVSSLGMYKFKKDDYLNLKEIEVTLACEK